MNNSSAMIHHIESGKHGHGLCSHFGKVCSDKTKALIGAGNRGRKPSASAIEGSRRLRLGRTYEEIYGVELAEKIKEKQGLNSNKEACSRGGRRGGKVRCPRTWRTGTEFLKGSVPWNKGLILGPQSEELKLQNALGVAAAHARGAYHTNKPTSLEHALDLLLQDAGLEYEAQKRFGLYIVDAYVPSRNLVFEADGMFWNHHKDKEREAKRDMYLLKVGITAVIHLIDEDLEPWIVI